MHLGALFKYSHFILSDAIEGDDRCVGEYGSNESMKWSYSAHGAFKRCHRMYFFRYVMSSHNARDPARRKSFLLSQLQHSSAWMGSLAHKVIAKEFIPFAKRGSPLSESKLVEHITQLAEKQYEFSEKKLYRTTKKKDAEDEYCALYAHEYGTEIDRTTTMSNVKEFASNIALNLLSQENILELLSHSSWLKSEVNLPWKMDTRATVFGQLDILAFMEDGNPVIIDWKTGSLGSGSKAQMAIYGKLVLNKWKRFNPEDIEIIEVNLRHGKVINHKMSDAATRLAEDFIYRSVSDILQVTQDHKFNTQIKRLSEYSYAGSENSCRYCSFRKLCEVFPQ